VKVLRVIDHIGLGGEQRVPQDPAVGGRDLRAGPVEASHRRLLAPPARPVAEWSPWSAP
jgi:hypothetical protein